MTAAQSNPLVEMIKAACLEAIREAMDIDERPLMTVKDASLALALSSREIYNMVENKELAAVRRGRRLMIIRKDLARWIEAHTVK
jgi:excisionase family DNA binding protein